MKFEGTIESKASRQKFYRFVTDPPSVISILPDVEESKVKDRDHFSVKSKVGLSYVKGSVSMNFEVVEKRQDEFAKLVGHGQGLQSSVDMAMEITLEDKGKGSLARWKTEANVGGLLASVGARLLGGAADKYVKQITENLKKKVES
ncbi:MAG TPA: SRPBCC domain-containing protein [Nitrososphaerales archaeon]|nr:SRPBCC domain-containing protein [Nitrososphaerales archaeon]